MKRAELLLPVGDMEMSLAAIHGGADAIYVGMPSFNARGRSAHFTVAELKEMIELCHLYGVKVHIAFNILIFEDEIDFAIKMLDEVMSLGPDAFIVQDIGLIRIIRELYPEMVIHGSTQMSITSSEAISFIEDLNISRFVLGRENSIPEIEKIRSQTKRELEVFIHGALCVAYSGQCFTSESIGGRSANRGQCAQSCRFSYELLVDGVKRDLLDQSYLLSPKDLCGVGEVKKLTEIGVDSFKVEGRLKGPIYAGLAGKTYREIIDSGVVNDSMVYKMATSYSRGFYSGWLHGVNHQELVHAKYQDHRGIYLGKVESIVDKKILFASKVPVHQGMGLVICDDHLKTEVGSNVFDTRPINGKVSVFLGRDFDSSKIKVGDDVYLSSDREVEKEILKDRTDLSRQKRVPVTMELKAIVGEKLELRVSDLDGHSVTILGDEELTASKNPFDEEVVKETISSLSRTVYHCHDLKLDVGMPKPFLHNKSLKKIRSEAVAALNLARIAVKPVVRNEIFPQQIKKSVKSKSFNLLLRNFNQVTIIADLFKNSPGEISKSIILDFEFGRDYLPAVNLLRELQKIVPMKIGIATNRILKPGEYHHLNTLIKLKPDFILVRNLGAIYYLQKEASSLPLKGDFSLNVANSYTANYLLGKGLDTVTSSYDLNANQLYELLKNSDASRVEVTVHQYMPSFHMEHCVFAAFLSNGTSFKDCGKPCEKHEVKLKDQFGNFHFIKADQECRNTMFNATAQSAATLLPKLLELGVSEFRVEMLDESDEFLNQKVKSYLDFFDGKSSVETLIKNVGEIEKFGLGTGQLLKEDRKKLRANNE